MRGTRLWQYGGYWRREEGIGSRRQVVVVVNDQELSMEDWVKCYTGYEA